MDELTDEELAQAQRLIDNRLPGRCTLRELYGKKKWLSVPKPQSFGIRFMASVENGSLKGIRYVDRRTNNHHEYEILG